jgi:hypothetical protein
VTDIAPNGPGAGLFAEDQTDVIVEVLRPLPKRTIRSEADLLGVIGGLKGGDYISLRVQSLNERSIPLRVMNVRIGGG